MTMMMLVSTPYWLWKPDAINAGVLPGPTPIKGGVRIWFHICPLVKSSTANCAISAAGAEPPHDRPECPDHAAGEEHVEDRAEDIRQRATAHQHRQRQPNCHVVRRPTELHVETSVLPHERRERLGCRASAVELVLRRLLGRRPRALGRVEESDRRRCLQAQPSEDVLAVWEVERGEEVLVRVGPLEPRSRQQPLLAVEDAS